MIKKSTLAPMALLIAALAFASSGLFAQVDFPQPSPFSTVEQKVGLTDVTIEYSRPGAKGRTIYGELVPYGKIWRTGANASTKVEFSSDVKIAGRDLPKGQYAFYTIPGENEWTIIFHKNTTYWGTGGEDYKEAEDALRVTARVKNIPRSVETFTIMISDISNNSATLDLAWENTLVSIPFTVSTDDVVMKSIDNAMAGPSGRLYFQSARYYFTEGKDMNQALSWVNKSIEMDGEKFWVLRLKSQIQAGLKDYKGAITTATRSKELATEAGNDDYVRMNDKAIEEWSAMR